MKKAAKFSNNYTIDALNDAENDDYVIKCKEQHVEKNVRMDLFYIVKKIITRDACEFLPRV